MQGDGSLVVGGRTDGSTDSDNGDFMACILDTNNNGAVVSTWKVKYTRPISRREFSTTCALPAHIVFLPRLPVQYPHCRHAPHTVTIYTYNIYNIYIYIICLLSKR